MIDKKRPDNREKGVLLPVFSLPSKYGIGCFSEEAREFIDWLRDTGHTYWQILPLNPTGNADSPYQPLCSLAGNAYFIDPVQLVQRDLLLQEELDECEFGSDLGKVDYEAFYGTRMNLLRQAHKRFEALLAKTGESSDAGAETLGEWNHFLKENASWLEDYALFMALREEYGKELSWDEWPDALRFRDPAAMARAREMYAEEIEFYRWTQYEFFRQWGELKAYANAAGIRVIGDLPVYVSYDSSDCWADPGQFELDEELRMKMIAGVPPDQFSTEGQLWGNPTYDWEKMKENDYSWWIRRIRQSFVLYDVLRLDHFRGYEAYYSCRADAENGIDGIWRPGPGMELFRKLEAVEEESAPEGEAPLPLSERFIAEDLGYLTEGVYQLLRETGFPGTRVIQFAFNGDPENLYLPENYVENCIAYTGTHDNDTTVGWFRELNQEERAGILQYLGYSGEDAWWLVLESDAAKQRAENLRMPDDGVFDSVNRSRPAPDPAVLATRLLIARLMNSRAKIVIIPMQDYMLLGSEARVNVPGTIVDNWCWRMKPGTLPKR